MEGEQNRSGRRAFLKRSSGMLLATGATAIVGQVGGAQAGTDLPSPLQYTGRSGPERFGADSVVTYESRERVAIIRINRPAQHNVVNAEVTDRLHDAWIHFNASNDLAAVLTAAGNDAFCAGGDDWKRAEDVWWCFPGVGVPVEKPIVCATAGAAVGTGLGLAIFSDLIIAADNTKFSYPECKAGVGGGVAASLAARIPQKIALELLLIGDPIDAQRAYEIGMVNRVVPTGTQVDVAFQYARKLAQNAPRAVAMYKRLVGETVPKSPAEQSSVARRQIIDVVYSADRVEFFNALKAGRRPVFTGD